MHSWEFLRIPRNSKKTGNSVCKGHLHNWEFLWISRNSQKTGNSVRKGNYAYLQIAKTFAGKPGYEGLQLISVRYVKWWDIEILLFALNCYLFSISLPWPSVNLCPQVWKYHCWPCTEIQLHYKGTRCYHNT